MNPDEVIYNPHNKPLSELPILYGFPTYVYQLSDLNYAGMVISPDGVILNEHISSSEGWLASDLGCTRHTARGEERSNDSYLDPFKKHYPDGFQVQYVPFVEIRSHAGLQRALAKYRDNAKADLTEVKT